MEISVIICTANRDSYLRDTLASLATVRTPRPTELLVVDNRSVDSTRLVVEQAARSFPFPVRYLYEGEQGKYGALNSGIRASHGQVIFATDDDARFEPDWIEQGVEGLSRHSCGFVGGRVLPLWEGRKPAWLDERDSLYAKVIAVLDFGDQVQEFGRGISWPLGVNVAYRRDVLEHVGLFDNRLGRKWGTLRNQAQREWHLRAQGAGVRGVYLPNMIVHHLVARERLKKQYFRRWFYWHGISRALLYRYYGVDMEEPELEHSPYSAQRSLGGVPGHLVRKALRSIRSLVWHTFKGDGDTAFQHELWLCFFSGVVRQRWVDRKLAVAQGPATVSARARRANVVSTIY